MESKNEKTKTRDMPQHHHPKGPINTVDIGELSAFVESHPSPCPFCRHPPYTFDLIQRYSAYNGSG